MEQTGPETESSRHFDPFAHPAEKEIAIMKAFINANLVFPDIVRFGTVLVENGLILASGDVIPPSSAEVIDVGGAYLGPGLVDIHVHGFASAEGKPEFYSADRNPAEMALAHLRTGTTSITPSAAYSWNKECFLSCIEKCRQAMEKGNTPIVGIHFEGPFTNPNYGANSEQAWTYSKENCDLIFDAAADAVLHCTYAPELPCAPELEDYLASRGIVMDIGHTELSPADAARAVKRGAKIVTHLFDAMGCWRGRDSISETGILQESADTILLATRGLYYELICDSRSVHVKPENIRLALRAAGEDAIILVTDCVDYASHNPHDYPGDNPKSAPDLNYNSEGQLSGSRLVLSQACRNFMKFTGADVRTAFKCAATNPAAALGLDQKIGSIMPGRDANLLIVDEAFQVQAVYFRGEQVVSFQ